MTNQPTGQARDSRAPGAHAQHPDESGQDGFASGSVILTLDGAIPVEFLSPGDRVITRDQGMALLRSVRRAEARCDMVAIAAGTLGHTRPDHDTLLPAHQKVLVRDWRAQALFGAPQALVPARKLIDGEFIRLAGRQTLTLFQLDFDTPHILYVDGMELASTSAPPLRRAA